MIERAINIAVTNHYGQKDKAGAPYILHPLRIMSKFKDKECIIVAALHDVVEDTSVTLDDLLSCGFSADIVDAIDAITKRRRESYTKFIERASKNKIARLVKIADLEDNMDLSRLKIVTDKDNERLVKYRDALRFLQLNV